MECAGPQDIPVSILEEYFVSQHNLGFRVFAVSDNPCCCLLVADVARFVVCYALFVLDFPARARLRRKSRGFQFAPFLEQRQEPCFGFTVMVLKQR